MVFSGILGLIGAPAISTDNHYRACICDMEYVALLNNYIEYSLDDNHAVILSFQSTSMHVFHAAVSLKCCVTF